MMLLTKLKLATVFVATVCMMGVTAASFFAPMRAADHESPEPSREPERAAKKSLASKIIQRENDIGDVASLLNIQRQVCELELQPLEDGTQLGVEVDVYKEGRKQKTYKGATLGCWQKPKKAKVALLAADLAYLPLAGGDRKNCRMRVNVVLHSNDGSASAGVGDDVPKELFDFTKVDSWNGFSAEAGNATETPLFWFLVSRTHKKFGVRTVPELLKTYPKSDCLIVYLRVKQE